MTDYTDAVARLLAANANAYDADTNSAGLDGRGGMDANLVADFNAIGVIGRDVPSAASGALVATSASTETIGSGAKSLTVETAKGFIAGHLIRAYDADNPTTKWMTAPVATYTTGTGVLTFTVASGDYAGSGSVSNWKVVLTGERGPTGPSATMATPAEAVAGTSTTLAVPPASLIVALHSAIRAL